MELLLGIAIAYSAIGIASTFLMSAGSRKSELALLHKNGAIRRQIVWFVVAESLVLTLIGIAASAVVSGRADLVPAPAPAPAPAPPARPR